MGARAWSGLDSLHPAKMAMRFKNTARQCWHMGFTSFGGPPVHFKIVSAPPRRDTTRATLSITRALGTGVTSLTLTRE